MGWGKQIQPYHGRKYSPIMAACNKHVMRIMFTRRAEKNCRFTIGIPPIIYCGISLAFGQSTTSKYLITALVRHHTWWKRICSRRPPVPLCWARRPANRWAASASYTPSPAADKEFTPTRHGKQIITQQRRGSGSAYSRATTVTCGTHHLQVEFVRTAVAVVVILKSTVFLLFVCSPTKQHGKPQRITG